MLLDYLMRHPDQITPLRADREEVRLLAGLCEGRRQAVEQRKALTNQLGACLKAYYPQALAMLGDLHSEVACAFLSRWPDPERLKAASDSQVRRFFYAQNCRGEERMQQRLEAVHKAVLLTRDQAVVVPSRMKMQGFVRLVRDLNRTLAEYDREIDRLYRQMPDHDVFSSFPGAGAAIGPRLLTAFGSDRSRFGRPDDMQCLSGTAPVTEQSGHSKWVRRRWQCNTFLHQTFHEYALHSISFSTWARRYVDAKVAQGKGFNTAVRALAYKWQRIMFACWQNHQTYDEARYLQALEKNRSPLMPHGAAPAALTQALRA
jgi:transposase